MTFHRASLRCALVSGVVAGIVATAVQIALWLAFAVPFPDVLYRDARHAAAIVLGRDALAGPAGFDARIMLVATLVHFALSIVYGIVAAPLVARGSLAGALVLGALFGLALYAINMYGATALFPWFTANRDAITLVTHIAFGALLAASYRACARNAALR
jgi:hypothetical protein